MKIKTKIGITVLLSVFLIICIVWIFSKREKEQIALQRIDFTIKLQQLNVGDSLIVGPTHYLIINEIEKQLKNYSNPVWLGTAAYPSCGVGLSNNPSYPKNKKFVYLIHRSSNSYYEILIEPRKLDNGIYTAKCLVVFVSSYD